MKIYTRTGDKGDTGYIGGRISKASDMIDLIGELDELNSSLGVVMAVLHEENNKELFVMIDYLFAIQGQIFELGALVASPEMKSQDSAVKRESLGHWVRDLESLIDKWDRELSVLQNFILPGGHEIGAKLHHARAVCRRAERTTVRLVKGLSNQPESRSSYAENLESVQKYLNRLSDALFTSARYVNHVLGETEQVWSSAGEQMRLDLG